MQSEAEIHKEDESHKKDDDHKIVTVTVDRKPKEVRKDKYLISEFKVVVGVVADYELDEVVHGEFKPLDDNAEIHIKGDEVFVSHVRQGGSS